MGIDSKKVRGYMRNIYRIGGSLGITIPEDWARDNLIQSGTKVSMVAYDNQLIIYRVDKAELEKLMIKAGALAIIKDSRRVVMDNHVKRINDINKRQKGNVKWQQKKL